DGEGEDRETEVIADLASLAGTGDDELVGGNDRGDEFAGVSGSEVGNLAPPGAGGDVLLQRRRAGRDARGGGDVDAHRQLVSQLRRQGGDVGFVAEVDIEVFGHRFVTG